LPKFDFETREELQEILGALGMPNAFDERADFSGISAEARLAISKVIHQANISVDEKGTQAAAVTVVGFDVSGPPPITCTVAADQPFLFAIRDRATGAILFLGRVVDPS
jgi:serpin B